MRLTHEVDNTTWSANEDVTPLLELLTLEAGRCAAVNNTGTQHRPITEAPSIIEDLSSQLTSWTHNENQWLSSNCIRLGIEVFSHIGARGSQLLCFTHQLGQNWDEESAGFAGPC